MVSPSTRESIKALLIGVSPSVIEDVLTLVNKEIQEWKDKAAYSEQQAIQSTMEMKRMRDRDSSYPAPPMGPPESAKAPMAPSPLSSQGKGATYRRNILVSKPAQSVSAPMGRVTLVFTDVQGSTKLWDSAELEMRTALSTHNKVIRKLIEKKNGYEVKTEGDAFMVAFDNSHNAFTFGLAAQFALVKCEWSDALLAFDDAKITKNEAGEIIFRGFRVRMGMHVGEPLCDIDPTTKRMDYFGPMVNIAARVSHLAHGGQIMISQPMFDDVHDEPNACFTPIGNQRLRGVSKPMPCYAVQPVAFTSRTFPTKTRTSAAGTFLEWADKEQLKYEEQVSFLEVLKKDLTEAGKESAGEPLSRKEKLVLGTPRRGERAAEKPTLVCIEIEGSRNYWTKDPKIFSEAILLYVGCIRSLIESHRGVELALKADRFIIQFQSSLSAVMFGIAVQEKMINCSWPSQVSDWDGLRPQKSRIKDMLLFNGCRVKAVMIHTAEDELRSAAGGASLRENGVQLLDLCYGGECIVAKDMYEELKPVFLMGSNVADVGNFVVINSGDRKDTTAQFQVVQVLPKKLIERTNYFTGQCEGEQDLDNFWVQYKSRLQTKVQEIVRAVQLLEQDVPSDNETIVAPEGKVVVVHITLCDTVELWETNTEEMTQALHMFILEVRRVLVECEGYEVKKTQDGEGFVLVFASCSKSCLFCVILQERLMTIAWPQRILNHTEAGADAQQRKLWRGLKCRMSVHYGSPYHARDPITRRVDYFGATMDQAVSLFSYARPGEVLVSEQCYHEVHKSLLACGSPAVTPLGLLPLKGAVQTQVYRFLPQHLKQRCFPPFNTQRIRAGSTAFSMTSWWTQEQEFYNQSVINSETPKSVRDGVSKCLEILSPSLLDQCVQSLDVVIRQLAVSLHATVADIKQKVQVCSGNLQEVTNILSLILKQGGTTLNVELETRDATDDWLVETVREYIPTLPSVRGATSLEPSSSLSSFSFKLQPGGGSGDDDSSEDDMDQMWESQTFGVDPPILYIIHNAVRHFLTLMKHFACGDERCKTGDEFVSKWVKYTDAIRQEIFGESRKTLELQLELVDQMKHCIDKDDNLKNVDVQKLARSVIGHLSRYFMSVRKAHGDKEDDPQDFKPKGVKSRSTALVPLVPVGFNMQVGLPGARKDPLKELKTRNSLSSLTTKSPTAIDDLPLTSVPLSVPRPGSGMRAPVKALESLRQSHNRTPVL